MESRQTKGYGVSCTCILKAVWLVRIVGMQVDVTAACFFRWIGSWFGFRTGILTKCFVCFIRRRERQNCRAKRTPKRVERLPAPKRRNPLPTKLATRKKEVKSVPVSHPEVLVKIRNGLPKSENRQIAMKNGKRRVRTGKSAGNLVRRDRGVRHQSPTSGTSKEGATMLHPLRNRPTEIKTRTERAIDRRRTMTRRTRTSLRISRGARRKKRTSRARVAKKRKTVRLKNKISVRTPEKYLKSELVIFFAVTGNIPPLKIAEKF